MSTFTLSESVLFSNPAAVEEPVYEDGEKSVRLFNGGELRLKKRQKHSVEPVDNGSFLDIDQLYEKIEKKQKSKQSLGYLREAQLRESKKPAPPSVMFTEKYRPKSYFGLCPAGNEKSYRTMMSWLQNARTKSNNKKILLVHGPSGIGKTTSVHVLAAQSGYAVQELSAATTIDSAAEDRAGLLATLRLRIKNALTTNSITSNGKPSCLVVDEIDSMANAGDIVRVLSEFVEGRGKNKIDINRPIVCIANELYPQSTRFGPSPMDKLRPMCDYVAFKRPGTSKSTGKINAGAQKSVKEHLAKISAKEKLALDSTDIADIFNICEGDIRACINHLQFSRNSSSKSSGTYKDQSMSWFAMVDRLFSRSVQKTKEEDFSDVLDTVFAEERSSSAGSLDKVIRGCFNRYLDAVHFQDDSARKPAEISDWLYYYDTMNSAQLDVGQYSTIAALKFWSLFSEINPQRSYEQSLLPNARAMEFEARELQKQNAALVSRFSDNLPLQLKLACSGCSANNEFYSCQLLPLLDLLMSPDIGSSRVKSSLAAPEKAMIERLAAVVKYLNLRLETQRDLDSGLNLLSFGPNWDPITNYDCDFMTVPFTAKAKQKHAKRSWLFPILQAEIEMAAKAPAKRVREVTPTEANPIQKKAKILSSIDFFKNQYDHVAKQIDDAPAQKSNEKTRIWVKHNEGFSNAVRKNIGWRDFWS